ncbi:hypothetical protein NMG60_11017010 [Bertholletia excelsa]
MKTPSTYPILDNRPIDKWKVTELKEELKRRKLTTKGLKEDLVQRLHEAIQNENELDKGSADKGFDSDHAAPETIENAVADVNDTTEVDVGLGPTGSDDIIVPLGGEEVCEGRVTGGTDIPRDKEVEVHATHVETADHVVATGEAGTLLAAPETTGSMVDDVNNAQAAPETTGKATAEFNDITKVDGGLGPTCSDDITVPLVGEEVCEGKVTGGTDIPRDENVLIHATYVETTVIETENAASEIATTAQESEKNECQSGSGGSKHQLESEEMIPPCEDVGLLSLGPNNQVSEVSTNLGFQVKSDSISSDCVSINEKNELKDTITDDNVKLEQDFKSEMVQPSSSNVLSDAGEPHAMDAEELPENKVPVDDRDFKDACAEMGKKNDSAVVISSEKLNLDRSSGDDSMEDDGLESKHIDSKYHNEVRDVSESAEVPPLKEEASIDGMQDDITEDKKKIHNESKSDLVAPTVKRKYNEKVEPQNLKVPEPENSVVSLTVAKDMFPSKHSFSRSDSTAGDNVPKERVVPPSSKPPTNSLRIDHFLRPFTLKAVQELLGKTGAITSFWMDHIKTHCFVTYSAVEEAIETRNAVYNLQWPPNGGRLLVAEFVDSQEVKMRVEAPPQSPATPVSSGPTISPSPRVVQPPTSSRQPVQRQPLPPPSPLPSPPPSSNPPPVRERIPLPAPPLPPENVEPSIVTLDDLFRKTKATPRIYYLPLSEEQVAAKLKAQGKGSKQ